MNVDNQNMDDIEEKSITINLNTDPTNKEYSANNEVDQNVPRTLPDLNINDNISGSKDNNGEENSPNFVTNSEDIKEKPSLSVNDDNEGEADESNGGELTDIGNFFLKKRIFFLF